MKNYNKILEAVNKGIQLALDDFDDEEQVQNIKSKQINHRDYTKEYLDLMKVVVDLGLPSGTLWCKYNLEAYPELEPHPFASDFYGNYYSWGETKIKNDYSYDTLTFCDDENRNNFSYISYTSLSVFHFRLNRNVLLQGFVSSKGVTVGLRSGGVAAAGPCSRKPIQGCDAGEL